MKPFQEYFSLEDFQKIYSDEDNIEFSTLYSALDKFLKENNLIKPFKNHMHHKTNFGNYWNKYINNNIENWEKEKIFQGIIDKFMFYLIYDKQELNVAYQKLTDAINQSNIKYFQLPELYDFTSGKTFSLKFSDWQPVLMSFKPDPNHGFKGTFEVAEDTPVQKIIECEIEFTTNKLIIADWFKIKEFTELVDKDNTFDINSEKGRLEQCQHYLDKFSFIHTTSWNNSYIYQNNDNFIIVEQSDNLNLGPYIQKGYIEKELRAVSIIEKSQLIELVGNEEIVEKYLSQYKDSITELKIQPGTYKFTLSSSPELIKSEFKNLFINQDEDTKEELLKLFDNPKVEPIFVMQKITPKLKNNIKLK
jgi:hypothetical protein